MGTLENTFSWSNSRASTFDRCRRAYWWQYYGAWGGWERNAPPQTRKAYVLKNLTSRWAWVGSAVHEWIERILLRLKDQAMGHLQFVDAPPDVDQEVEALTEHMRDQYRQSLSGRYHDSPKRCFGLMEHEYSDPVSREEWKAASDKARQALRGFLEGEIFERIRVSDPGDWMAVEQLDQFQLDGVGIWAVPDFARRVDAVRAELYDWKTGAVKPEKSRLQMACYTLYMQLKHGVAPGSMKTYLVYLGDEVEVHGFDFTTKDLAEAREEIRASIERMRARLKEPTGNVAEAGSFPLTDDLHKCRVCVYRRLCGRETPA